MRVAIVLGTRPEAIKLAPVYYALLERGFEVELISTGQHRELLVPTLDLFRLVPSVDLDLMQVGQTLSGLTSRIVASLESVLSERKYDYVIAQGDTTTAFCTGLAAFYQKLRVGHVEAGLRTAQRYSPFPEEINRRLLSVLTSDHFCPTERARQNLLREGFDPESILVTGNTVIDALRWVRRERHAEIEEASDALGLRDGPYVLMTTHRRESFGAPMRDVLGAVRSFLMARPHVRLILPLHRNPAARDAVVQALQDVPNAHLINDVDYVTFAALIRHSLFIVTDSGGIQEEAPYFNKRTLVIREVTERPEAIEAGVARLVGTRGDLLLEAMGNAEDEVLSGDMPDLASINPFGDGYAAERIAERVAVASQ